MFVLGCDPTAFDKAERIEPFVKRESIELKSVFDIGGKDEWYFAGILANLDIMEINMDQGCVRNLVTQFVPHVFHNSHATCVTVRPVAW